MISRWWVKIECVSSLFSVSYVSLDTYIVVYSETFFKNTLEKEALDTVAHTEES